MNKINKIETFEDFKLLLKNPNKLPNEVSFDLDTLDNYSNQKYSKLVTKYKNECGCNLGGIFLLISAIFGLIWLVSIFKGVNTIFFINIIYLSLFIICVSILGKLMGLTIAKFKLRKTLKEMNKNITQHGIYESRV